MEGIPRRGRRGSLAPIVPTTNASARNPTTIDAVKVEQVAKLAEKLSFFHQIPKIHRRKFIKVMVLEDLEPESVYCREREAGSSLSVVLRGSMAVFLQEADEKHGRAPTSHGRPTTAPNNLFTSHSDDVDSHHVAMLSEGDCFGVQSLLEGADRSTTLVCVDSVQLATLTRKAYDEVIQKLAMHEPFSEIEVTDLLSKASSKRRPVDLQTLRSVLRTHKLFQMLHKDTQLTICEYLRCTVVRLGSQLVRQGDEIMYAFWVISGSMSEHHLTPREMEELQRASPTGHPDEEDDAFDLVQKYGSCRRLLCPGDYFGYNQQGQRRASSSFVARESTILARISIKKLEELFAAVTARIEGYERILTILNRTPSARKDLDLEFLNQATTHLKFFQVTKPEARIRLMRTLRLVSIKAGDIMYKQGSSTDRMYIVCKGSLSFHVKDEDMGMQEHVQQQQHHEDDDDEDLVDKPANENWESVNSIRDVQAEFGKCLMVVTGGQSFGERCVSSNHVVNDATVIAREDCDLIELSRYNYKSIVRREGSSKDEVIADIVKVLEKRFKAPSDYEFLTPRLRAFPFFQKLPQDMCRFAFERMKYERLESDTIIFQEGDPGENLFIILSGSVSVHVRPHASVATENEEGPKDLISKLSPIASPKSSNKRAKTSDSEGKDSSNTEEDDEEGQQTAIDAAEAKRIEKRRQEVRSSVNKKLMRVKARLKIHNIFDTQQRVQAKTKALEILEKREYAQMANYKKFGNKHTAMRTNLKIRDVDTDIQEGKRTHRKRRPSQIEHLGNDEDNSVVQSEKKRSRQRSFSMEGSIDVSNDMADGNLEEANRTFSRGYARQLFSRRTSWAKADFLERKAQREALGRMDGGTYKSKITLTEKMNNFDIIQKFGPSVGIISSGAMFGEMTLMSTDAKRTATLLTNAATHLISIDRQTYLRTVRIRKKVTGVDEIADFFQSIPMFSTLTRPQLSKLAYNVEESKYKRNEKIYSQGDPSDDVYFILNNGSVKLVQDVVVKPAARDEFSDHPIKFTTQLPNVTTVDVKCLHLAKDVVKKVNIDLIILGNKEVCGTYEALRGEVHGKSCYALSDVDVLVMKRSVFQVCVPKRVLRNIREIDVARQVFYDQRVFHYISTCFLQEGKKIAQLTAQWVAEAKMQKLPSKGYFVGMEEDAKSGGLALSYPLHDRKRLQTAPAKAVTKKFNTMHEHEIRVAELISMRNASYGADGAPKSRQRNGQVRAVTVQGGNATTFGKMATEEQVANLMGNLTGGLVGQDPDALREQELEVEHQEAIELGWATREGVFSKGMITNVMPEGPEPLGLSRPITAKTSLQRATSAKPVSNSLADIETEDTGLPKATDEAVHPDKLLEQAAFLRKNVPNNPLLYSYLINNMTRLMTKDTFGQQILNKANGVNLRKKPEVSKKTYWKRGLAQAALLMPGSNTSFYKPTAKSLMMEQPEEDQQPLAPYKHFQPHPSHINSQSFGGGGGGSKKIRRDVPHHIFLDIATRSAQQHETHEAMKRNMRTKITEAAEKAAAYELDHKYKKADKWERPGRRERETQFGNATSSGNPLDTRALRSPEKKRRASPEKKMRASGSTRSFSNAGKHSMNRGLSKSFSLPSL